MIVERREENEVLSRMIMLLEVAEHCFAGEWIRLRMWRCMAGHSMMSASNGFGSWSFYCLNFYFNLLGTSEAQLSVWQALTSCEVLGWASLFY